MRKPTRRSCSSGTAGAKQSWYATGKARLPLATGHRCVDAFDRLPDDLVIAVLAGLAAGATCPADLAEAALTCRRFRELAAHPAVLSRASPAAVSVRASRWSETAHRFLRRCAAAGNLHACYFLGMVRFYCLSARASGAALLARAAAGRHAAALYALAVVQFNGSGGGKADRDPRAGVVLCGYAAWLGHLPALRELGHCLQDGYGARRDDAAGRRLLLHAAAREFLERHGCHSASAGWGDAEYAARRFMVEWSARPAGKEARVAGGSDGDGEDLQLCSQVRCGRRETRRHEFRRCAVCGSAIYCSRACQALDWKLTHRGRCEAVQRWLAAGDAR